MSSQTRGALIGHRSFNAFGWKQGILMAEGAWIAAGVENPAALKVECFRGRAQCIVAEAEYGQQLIPVIDYFEIQLWDASEIRSRPADNMCQRSILVINRVEETVTIVRSALSKGDICEVVRRDTSVAYNRSAHLATERETDSMEREQTRILFDSLLNLSPALRRTLSILRDTAALRAAVGKPPR